MDSSALNVAKERSAPQDFNPPDTGCRRPGRTLPLRAGARPRAAGSGCPDGMSATWSAPPRRPRPPSQPWPRARPPSPGPAGERRSATPPAHQWGGRDNPDQRRDRPVVRSLRSGHLRPVESDAADTDQLQKRGVDDDLGSSIGGPGPAPHGNDPPSREIGPARDRVHRLDQPGRPKPFTVAGPKPSVTHAPILLGDARGTVACAGHHPRRTQEGQCRLCRRDSRLCTSCMSKGSSPMSSSPARSPWCSTGEDPPAPSSAATPAPPFPNPPSPPNRPRLNPVVPGVGLALGAAAIGAGGFGG